MPARLYSLLRAEGLRLSDGIRPGQHRPLPRHESRRIRAPARVPDGTPDAPENPERSELHVPEGWRVLGSRGQARAMPHIPFLARTARQPPGMEEDGALLPRDGQGPAHSDRGGEGAGARDAGELPGDVLTVLGAGRIRSRIRAPGFGFRYANSSRTPSWLSSDRSLAVRISTAA